MQLVAAGRGRASAACFVVLRKIAPPPPFLTHVPAE